MPGRVLMLLIALVPLLLSGCAVPGEGEFQVADGDYNAAFDAARDTLIHRRFDLERVDSRAGVITTKPKPTSGLATPWDTEQTTLGQEIEDFANGQRRIIRITFEPANPPPGSGPPEDMREVKGPLAARVEVVVERIHSPGWNLQTTAVRFSTHAEDTQLEQRGMWPTYYVPFSQDRKLAGRIAAGITDELKK